MVHSLSQHNTASTLVPFEPARVRMSQLIDTVQKNCTITDARTLELFRSQYKYMQGRDKVIAMDLALETGIDAEIIAGYMTGFPDDLYFHPPYAPLFVINDTLCVFDHYRERIARYNSALHPIGEALGLAIGLNSWRRSAGSGVSWKGRTYQISNSPRNEGEESHG